MSIDENPPDLIAAVAAILSTIAQQADSAERDRRLPADIVKALADAGAIHMLVPRALGGAEAHPMTMLRVLEAIAQVDASAAWVTMIGSTNAINTAYLDPAIAREIYGQGPGIFTGGIVAPRGTAVPVDGGFRVSGRWPFASGCQHASWMALNCLVQDESGATSASRQLFLQLPAADFTIIDTWDVSGLRATGSHDVDVNDAFVPTGYGYALGVDRPRHEGTLYGFSVMGLLAIAVASVALGIGRGAVEDILDLAGAKTPMGRRRPLADWNVAQVELAQAEAALRSGRAFLSEAITDMWGVLENGELPSREQRALVRLAATAAVQGAVRAVDTAYNLGGGSSIYATSTLQRRFRDIHTLTQHVMIGQSSLEAAGRALLGQEVPPGFL